MAESFKERARKVVEDTGFLQSTCNDFQRQRIAEKMQQLAELAYSLGQGEDPRYHDEMREDPSLRPTESRLLELLEIERGKSAKALDRQHDAEHGIEELDKNWAWCIHEEYEEDPRPELPLPRLEMRAYDRAGPRGLREWGNIQWLYGLMYKAHWGSVMFIPLGLTMESGGCSKPEPDGLGRYEPFRESHHIRTDMKTFDIRGYIIIENEKRADKIVQVQPFPPRNK
jgi:hypothetical protein